MKSYKSMSTFVSNKTLFKISRCPNDFMNSPHHFATLCSKDNKTAKLDPLMSSNFNVPQDPIADVSDPGVP